ncbi:hypothetical protein HMPREF0971_00081 [Segatella oris F0302]|uniref:Uncharacterized protein n=1 Tax=Segatella oris F0302 TaxID=649760 RepID=D1QMS2_9BACT|nr:hypothetical protein HMPREF0971_00081 [Segatella oris F0302]
MYERRLPLSLGSFISKYYAKIILISKFANCRLQKSWYFFIF